MNVNMLFLAALKAALNDEMLEWDQPVSQEEWYSVFELSEQQNVTPLVYQSVYASKAFRETGAFLADRYKAYTQRLVFIQVQKTQEFIQLYRKLSEKGLTPVVVKGIMCRILLKNGDCRPSGDEDLLIPADAYSIYREALISCGMEIAPWDADKEECLHEISYCQKNGNLKIEVHRKLFDDALSAYKDINHLFSDVYENSILENVEGVQIRTMNYTDHMLFLILHAFKHFISSGFGIRQIADITVFANAHGKEIEWKKLLGDCTSVNAHFFAASLFDIAIRYLGMDIDKAAYPVCWQELDVNSDNMLADIFAGGIFGGNDMSRKHSANMTLSAVSAQKEGKPVKNSTMKTVFPPASVLQSRYPWLVGKSWLLPFAWVHRILKYHRETSASSGNSASDSIRIGNERLELLRQYGIIENGSLKDD